MNIHLIREYVVLSQWYSLSIVAMLYMLCLFTQCSTKWWQTYQRQSAWAAGWGLEEGCAVWFFGWRSVYSDSSHRSSGSPHPASPPAKCVKTTHTNTQVKSWKTYLVFLTIPGFLWLWYIIVVPKKIVLSQHFYNSSRGVTHLEAAQGEIRCVCFDATHPININTAESSSHKHEIAEKSK